jgi:hypothetical protein
MAFCVFSHGDQCAETAAEYLLEAVLVHLYLSPCFFGSALGWAAAPPCFLPGSFSAA